TSIREEPRTRRHRDRDPYRNRRTRHMKSTEISRTPRKSPRATPAATFSTNPRTPTAASSTITISSRSNPMATFRRVQCTPGPEEERLEHDLDRKERVAVPALEGPGLPGPASPARVVPLLLGPFPGRRGQQLVLPPPRRSLVRPVERTVSLRVRLRAQSEPLHHTHQATP